MPICGEPDDWTPEKTRSIASRITGLPGPAIVCVAPSPAIPHCSRPRRATLARVSDHPDAAAGNLAPVVYKVHTDIFEGPFDLLLRLITEQRVDLYEVALSDIVDAFLAEVEAMQRLDLEVATEFLVIAATLVELKCRRLLPGREDSDEECLALLEERDYLLARLVECTTFSAAGSSFARAELAASRSWPRLAGLDERFDGLAARPARLPEPRPRPGAALRALRDQARPGTSRPTTSSWTRSPSPRWSRPCAGDCRGRPATTFRELTAAARTRMEVVVHFLGLLELYKQGLVELEQATTFGELRRELDRRAGAGQRARRDGGAGQPGWLAGAGLGVARRPRLQRMSLAASGSMPEEPAEEPPGPDAVGRSESAAIEAVLTVATEPVPPGFSPSCSSCLWSVWSSCAPISRPAT